MFLIGSQNIEICPGKYVKFWTSHVGSSWLIGKNQRTATGHPSFTTSHYDRKTCHPASES